MNRKAWALLGLVGLFMFMGRYQVRNSVATALQNANVRAFLALIRKPESNGEYNVLYGGGHFSDYSAHPHVKVPFFNPATQKMDYSTAAGAYQITYPTWLTVQAVLPLPDFSPASQDMAAVVLLGLKGLIGPIEAGDFQTAIQGASKIWASMPYTASGQGHISLARAQEIYQQNGGVIA